MVVYRREHRCDWPTEDADFGKKKVFFSDEAHFDPDGIRAFGAQKTGTHTLKSWRTQNELLLGADFGPET